MYLMFFPFLALGSDAALFTLHANFASQSCLPDKHIALLESELEVGDKIWTLCNDCHLFMSYLIKPFTQILSGKI